MQRILTVENNWQDLFWNLYKVSNIFWSTVIKNINLKRIFSYKHVNCKKVKPTGAIAYIEFAVDSHSIIALASSCQELSQQNTPPKHE